MNPVVFKIEQIRKSKGIKKSHIAKHCGKTPSWYTDITKGRNRLSVDDLLLVAESLGEDPSIFFDQKLSVTLNKRKKNNSA